MKRVRRIAELPRFVLAMIASVVVGLFLIIAAGPASADSTYIYWTTNNSSSAGRADIDGQNPNFTFFTTGGPSSGLAINSQHIFWPVDLNGFVGTTIGTANPDGSSANQNTIATTYVPYGIAIDSGHIYWANHWHGSIGRANLDGSGANPDFITGIAEPEAVAVDGSHIYWASFGPSPYTGTGRIGRANLDGTGVNLNFITGASNPQGIAVTNSFIYWTNGLGGIGRANIDGTSPNQAFIASFGGPAGIAVTSSHIYWAEVTSYRIIAANLDGTGSQILINTVDQPWGVAVATIAAPAPILPTLSLSAPTSVTVGQTVTLDGTTVGGDTTGHAFTLDLTMANGGSSASLASSTGTAFPLAVHSAWTPSSAGSYTATLNLLDASNTIVATTSQLISASAPPAPAPDPAPAPAPTPAVAPIVSSIAPPVEADTVARTAQHLVITKFAVQKNGKVKVVGGKSAWLPGHHAYFTNVTTDPRLVSPEMVRYGRALAREYGGVFGGIVVGEKWHFPRIVAAYFD